MSDSLVLANQMIDDGAISIINDMVKRGGLEDNIVGNLTIALVNLTRVSGKEGQVVEATIHQAFTNILTTNPDLGPACARGLYNLTCVDSTYPLIEKVSRALIQLSSTSTVQNVKHICAAALCNLADLKAARMRLVEEGVIGVLGALSKGSETRTRRVCAVILQNLSASRACRVEMVSRGSVQAAHSLSSDTDPIILRCIGLTLSRLASEPANASRIIHELGDVFPSLRTHVVLVLQPYFIIPDTVVPVNVSHTKHFSHFPSHYPSQHTLSTYLVSFLRRHCCLVQYRRQIPHHSGYFPTRR